MGIVSQEPLPLTIEETARRLATRAQRSGQLLKYLLKSRRFGASVACALQIRRR